MPDSIRSKASAHKHRQQTVGSAQQLVRHPIESGPQADILALQDAAGNRAVSQLLQPVTGGSLATADGVPPIVEEVLKSGGGQPLDPSTRAIMESRFGHDFSHVQVHTDAQADKSARVVNAEAYTVGTHIVLGVEHTLETRLGQRVLAHELAHVIQQSRGGVTPSPMRGSGLEQSADQAASAVTQGSGPVQVFGASGPGLARQPRSLSQSLPRSLSDAELEQEINLISQWLQDNPSSSVEHNRLMAVLQALVVQAANRQIAGYERQYGQGVFLFLPPVLKQQVQLANLAAGFTGGFLAGARLACPPDKVAALTRLEAELSEFKNRALYNLGIPVGIHWGMIKGFWDNIVGLYEMAKLAFRLTPPGQLLTAIEGTWAYVQDPEGYRALKAQEADENLELVEGLWEFIKLLETDPAFLLEQGEALGFDVGTGSARWFHDEFMQMTSFKKGMTVGEVGGRILIEVALLFVGPEVLVARGALALGRTAMKAPRLAKVVLEMLERVPKLRRLLEARRLAKGAAAKQAVEAAGDVGSTAAKFEPPPAPGAKKLEPATPEAAIPAEAPKAPGTEAAPSTAAPTEGAPAKPAQAKKVVAPAGVTPTQVDEAVAPAGEAVKSKGVKVAEVEPSPKAEPAKASTPPSSDKAEPSAKIESEVAKPVESTKHPESVTPVEPETTTKPTETTTAPTEKPNVAEKPQAKPLEAKLLELQQAKAAYQKSVAKLEKEIARENKQAVELGQKGAHQSGTERAKSQKRAAKAVRRREALQNQRRELKRRIDEIDNTFKKLNNSHWQNHSYNDSGKVDPCFAPGTLVKTPNGDRAIEALSEGDLVLAYDFESNAVVEVPILGMHRNWSLHLVDVRVAGETITCTRMHPFWVESANQWLPARSLQEDMVLRTVKLESVAVQSMTTRASESTTYNLDVFQMHTFFVGAAGILVHNANTSFASTKADFTEIYAVYNQAGKEVYIGKTIQGRDVRFGQHASAKAHWESLGYRMGETPLKSGVWTPYEQAVWEQHFIDKFGGARSTNPTTPLENEFRAITEDNYDAFKANNNPCP